MMEVYRTPSKETQEILLASAIYAEVIEGLNGYFTSEPRNEYITIHRRIDSRTFYLYDPEAWADILITWLRTKHEIFYYPGMEAKYAKMEKIPSFTERMMDEGAYNSLKALHKRVTGKETSTNSHTLIADNIKYFVNEEESDIKKLKDRIAELESNFKAVCDEDDIFRTRALKAEEEVRKLNVELNTLKDTVSRVRSGLNKKFCPLGYEDDLEKLADIAVKAVEERDETISRINTTAQKDAKQECYDYLWNALKNLSPDCDALKIERYEGLVDRIFYEMSLIEDGCKRCQRNHSTYKFNYIRRTNKAEEEVKKLKEKLDKATADYQALSEENQKLKFKLNGSIGRQEYTIELRAKTRAEIENYKLKLKDYILKDIKEHGYRYDGLQSKSVEEIVGFIIAMATCPRNEWANCEIKKLRSQIDTLKGLINAMNEEVKDM